MKSQYSLTQLAQELERRAANKQDFVLPAKKLAMTESNEIAFFNGKTATSLPATDIAHEQIADRLQIPAKYYNRMRRESPELLMTNANHWLGKGDDNRMVRTLDGQVRAFLSDRYQRIENEEIASTVLPILLETEGVKIESCAITESRMYIKAVFSRISGEVSKGDVVQAGIAISNSEVGRGMVKIEPLIYRLVCLNGLIIPDNRFSMRHVGGRIEANEGVYEMLSDEAIEADDRAIMLKVRDVVRGSFDEVRFQQNLALMRDAREDKIEGDPSETVKVLSKKHSLNEFETGSVLRHLIEGADISRWGVLNAVTRTAQDVESYDRSHELETLGGTILNLPKTAWRELAIAA